MFKLDQATGQVIDARNVDFANGEFRFGNCAAKPTIDSEPLYLQLARAMAPLKLPQEPQYENVESAIAACSHITEQECRAVLSDVCQLGRKTGPLFGSCRISDFEEHVTESVESWRSAAYLLDYAIALKLAIDGDGRFDWLGHATFLREHEYSGIAERGLEIDMRIPYNPGAEYLRSLSMTDEGPKTVTFPELGEGYVSHYQIQHTGHLFRFAVIVRPQDANKGLLRDSPMIETKNLHEDSPILSKWLLSTLLQKLCTWQTKQVSFGWIADESGETKYSVLYPTLISKMWHDFSFAYSAAKLRMCPICGKVFPVGNRQKSKIYCDPQTCGRAASNHDYYMRHRDPATKKYRTKNIRRNQTS